MEKSSDLAVSLRDVNRSYRNGIVQAVRDINLEIHSGKFIIYAGASGSGKTTLMNIIGGLDRPSSGEVHVLSENYNSLSENQLTKFRRENIGFIWQFGNLFPSLSALQNVMMPLEFDSKWSFKDAKKRSEELLVLLGLDKRINHHPGQMSGGEIQRVAIARALVNNPKIILADEPTGNVDSDNGTMIAELLKKLNVEQKITIIVVTHNLSLFKEYGKVYQIKDGILLQ